jgi:hypothetical protein
MACLRAVCSITPSLTGNTLPTKSRAILNFGQSVIVKDRIAAQRLGRRPIWAGDNDLLIQPILDIAHAIEAGSAYFQEDWPSAKVPPSSQRGWLYAKSVGCLFLR